MSLADALSAQRFWSKVAILGPDKCWLWTGARNEYGYGNVHFAGRYHKAHRVAYGLTVGPIPNGLFVCHTCDNPPCVNPAHLWLGTNADNLQDMRDKGRYLTPKRIAAYQAMAVAQRGRVGIKGERNGNARLTAAAVELIRTRYAAGSISQDALAAEYGVSQVRISQIVRGRGWRL